jgi:hypothetical protein
VGKFSDLAAPEPDSWASIRLADVNEVARRLRRSGMRNVRVDLAHLMVSFTDPVVNFRVRLEIEPWHDGSPGWYWYAHLTILNGFSMGPLCKDRRPMDMPWPREVVRAYLRETWYERRPPRKKKHGRR